MTDPRVALSVAHYESGAYILSSTSIDDDGNVVRGPAHDEWLYRRAASEIAHIEAAGLLVVADNEATVELICDALNRHQYEGFRNVAEAFGAQRKPWDQVSDRLKQIRRNQFIDAAQAVAAALRSTPPADPAAAGTPKDSAE